MIGSKISHYKIVEKLGEGGMGVVYKADDTKLARSVALKFLPAHLLGNEDVRARFEREAKAAAALHHPNICPVYEIDEVDGRAFIAMAFIEGDSLDKKIAHGPLPLDNALDIARQVAEGLGAAHAKGVVHRDIKPENVIVDGNGHVTIMDFGLAQLTEASRLTRTDETLGTTAYMSPEQTQGSGTDQRTDIWSLGVVLYEMVAGQQPFKGDYDKAVMYSILNEAPEPPTALRTGVPMELEVLINKCLAKNAAERYKDAGDIVVDLSTLRKKLESGRSKVLPRATSEDLRAAPHAQPKRFALAVALAAAAVFCGLWLSARGGGAPPTTPVPSYELSQLTFDPGLTFQPAVSADGKLVAYASDRGGEGNLDIWVQQRNGSQPICLTTNQADDLEPEFSPDGTRIAFRSHREPRGVYIVETLGGEPRMLAAGGQRPRFSPSGEWIAYHDRRSTFIIAANGGEPRPILEGLALAAYAIWLIDETLLLQGEESPGAGREWWVFDLAVNKATTIDVGPYLRQANLNVSAGPNSTVPGAYVDVLGGVVVGDPTSPRGDIWLLPMDESGSSLAAPIQLTRGTSRFADASSDSDANLAVASLTTQYDIWRIPIDANSGRVLGEPEKVISEQSLDQGPVVSRDGELLSWTSNRSGNWDAWLLDVPSGRRRQLTISPEPEVYASMSADGRWVSYVVTDDPRSGDSKGIGLLELSSGTSRLICNDCGRLNGVAPDGSGALSWKPQNDRVEILYIEASTGRTSAIASKGDCRLFGGQFSPDGNWIAFQGSCDYGGTKPYVVPFRGNQAIPEGDWIPVSDRPQSTQPRWSPDGNLVYFLSDQDGFTCLWARRLQPETKQPLGDPFAVQHFHEFRVSPNNIRPGSMGLSFSEDFLYLALGELTGNVWMMERER